MGKSLREQLFREGLVNERTFHEGEAERKLQAGAEQALVRRSDKKGGSLDACQDARELCEYAKEVLLHRPTEIQAILKRVHELRDAGKADKRMIWTIYRVRDLLPTCPQAKRETFLKRAFRKSNPKVEIPID